MKKPHPNQDKTNEMSANFPICFLFFWTYGITKKGLKSEKFKLIRIRKQEI